MNLHLFNVYSDEQNFVRIRISQWTSTKQTFSRSMRFVLRKNDWNEGRTRDFDGSCATNSSCATLIDYTVDSCPAGRTSDSSVGSSIGTKKIDDESSCRGSSPASHSYEYLYRSFSSSVWFRDHLDGESEWIRIKCRYHSSWLFDCTEFDDFHSIHVFADSPSSSGKYSSKEAQCFNWFFLGRWWEQGISLDGITSIDPSDDCSTKIEMVFIGFAVRSQS